MPYRVHLTKSMKHEVNGIPPCRDIPQELQLVELDRLRYLRVCEPVLAVAFCDNSSKVVLMLYQPSNGLDCCTSC